MRDFAHGDYQLTIPANWLDATQVLLLGPPGPEGYSPSLMITREDLVSKVAAEEYAEQQRVPLATALGALDYRVESEKPVKLGEVPAFERIHSFKPKHLFFRVRQIQTYVLRGKEAYVVTATDREERFAESEPAFRIALMSLHFARPQV